MRNRIFFFFLILVAHWAKATPVPGFYNAIDNNIIGNDQLICSNTVPAPLTGSDPTGGTGEFTFQWQSSSTSATAGFADIEGATGKGYAPGAIAQTQWYRRVVFSGTESNTSAAIQISADPMPGVSINYERSPYCGAGRATVTLQGQTGGVYSSSTGLSIDAGTGEIDLAASVPGSYTVNYTFTSGACTGTATTNVNVGDPTLVITNPLPVCGSPTADITDPAITEGSTSGLIYRYFTDVDGTMPVSNPEAVSESATYYIRGSSDGGCFTTIEPVVVVLNDQPVITADEMVVVCKGLPAMLRAYSPGNAITWLNLGAGDSIEVQPAGNAIYKAVAVNDAGCTDTATVRVQIQDFSISLIANPNPMLVGSPATLTTSANASYNVIAWQPEIYFGNQTATSQSLIVSDTTSTFYVIGRSAEGCMDTASVKTTVDNKDFFIPNAFTPNNDGKNDVFRVYGSSVTGAEIKIFNQWGALVFETGDNQQGWNGTHKNRPQPVGVYVYVVKVRLSNEDSFIKKGTVRLIR
ncbi:MAG: gliding motility-associated C-terminal domain-containing protein [Chitinophagaceae bacterium]|nr:gliding motility-associated C-terminal domain-containing protein [Chitinophagaceae bacterium]